MKLVHDGRVSFFYAHFLSSYFFLTKQFKKFQCIVLQKVTKELLKFLTLHSPNNFSFYCPIVT